MSLAIIDYIFIAAVLIALIVGLVKGFLSRLISLGGLILGIIVAGQFSAIVSDWMASLIEAEATRNLVAYIVCIVVVFIIVSIIGKALKKVVTSVKLLKSLDRILGAVLSVGIVYIIFGFIFVVVNIETEIVLLQYIFDALETLMPSTSLALSLYGENAVGNWLVSMLFTTL